MDFDVADDHAMLREQARKLLTARAGCARLRQVHARGETMDRDLWREIAGLGWLGIAVPEHQGGIGMDGAALCVLAECAGAALPAVPLAQTLLAIEAIRLGGSEAQMARYLPGLCAGELIGTIAMAGGSCVTLRSGHITGIKAPVPHAMDADIAIVWAEDEAGETRLSIVDLREDGCERAPIATIDPYFPHARISFVAAAAEPLGATGGALARTIEDRAAVVTAFEQLGAAEACLTMARGYALERKVFSRPIGSFQAVKHRLADMLVRNEVARSNAYHAAWALDAPLALPEAASAARLSATDAAEFAARENLHLHGGMGFTEEADCHFYLRRSRVWALALGGEADWAERLLSNHLAATAPIGAAA